MQMLDMQFRSTVSRLALAAASGAAAFAGAALFAGDAAAQSCSHLGQTVNCPAGVAPGSTSVTFLNGGTQIQFNDGTIISASLCCSAFTPIVTPTTPSSPSTSVATTVSTPVVVVPLSSVLSPSNLASVLGSANRFGPFDSDGINPSFAPGFSASNTTVGGDSEAPGVPAFGFPTIGTDLQYADLTGNFSALGAAANFLMGATGASGPAVPVTVEVPDDFGAAFRDPDCSGGGSQCTAVTGGYSYGPQVTGFSLPVDNQGGLGLPTSVTGPALFQPTQTDRVILIDNAMLTLIMGLNRPPPPGPNLGITGALFRANQFDFGAGGVPGGGSTVNQSVGGGAAAPAPAAFGQPTLGQDLQYLRSEIGAGCSAAGYECGAGLRSIEITPTDGSAPVVTFTFGLGAGNQPAPPGAPMTGAGRVTIAPQGGGFVGTGQVVTTAPGGTGDGNAYRYGPVVSDQSTSFSAAIQSTIKLFGPSFSDPAYSGPRATFPAAGIESGAFRSAVAASDGGRGAASVPLPTTRR